MVNYHHKFSESRLFRNSDVLSLSNIINTTKMEHAKYTQVHRYDRQFVPIKDKSYDGVSLWDTSSITSTTETVTNAFDFHCPPAPFTFRFWEHRGRLFSIQQVWPLKWIHPRPTASFSTLSFFDLLKFHPTLDLVPRKGTHVQSIVENSAVRSTQGVSFPWFLVQYSKSHPWDLRLTVPQEPHWLSLCLDFPYSIWRLSTKRYLHLG